MEAVHSQIASIQEQINATQVSIQGVAWEIVEVQGEINDVELKMGTATSQKEIDRLLDDKKQLAEDIEQLEEDKKQQAQREKQLRAELVCWSEELTRLTIAVAQREGRWDLSMLEDLQRLSHPLEPSHTVEFIGRAAACDVIGKVAGSNFINRARIDHAGFSFLVASGHVGSGKTRTGIETPRLVDEMCSALSEGSTSINFVKTVYLKIDFLKDARFDPQFDVKEMDVSVTLGSRLMNAFYKHQMLKKITHDVALHHIITTVLADGETDSNTVVPLVIHFDEHGRFIKAMDEDRGKPVGKFYFEELLRMIGSAATSEQSPLSDLRTKGRYFIVGITTGTSFRDASFRTAGQYAVQKILLPVLDGPNTERLAIELLKLNPTNRQIDKILSDPLFRIALADTAGLPGLIHFLCETIADASYVEYLNYRVGAYLAGHVWSQRWDSLTTIALARPRMVETSIIEDTYTLRDALDSGTVLYDEIQHEIRLVPVLLASYNAQNPTFHSLVLKSITHEVGWNWQDFKKSHVLYLAATMMALQKERGRFENNLTLGTFLRHVEPQSNAYLKQRLLLSSVEKFNGTTFKMYSNQCISVNQGKKRKHNDVTHDVHTECKNCVVLAAPGTPLIDAYLNLQLVGLDPSGQEIENPTTLFLQYKHTSVSTKALQIKVSAMNKQVAKLSKTLAESGWDSSLEWLFLWVSNRPILEDTIPHSKLLWVGKANLEQHAPLIARRGLAVEEGTNATDV